MRLLISMLVVVLAVLAPPAFAQTFGEETSSPSSTTEDSGGMVVWTAVTWPTELNEQPLVMSKGMIQIHLDAIANLSSGGAFKPFALAPDIYYGITDRITVGLIHTIGLCLTGTDGGCRAIYDDVGLQGRFLVTRTYNLELAGVASFEAVTIDPFALGLRLGVAFKYKMGRLAFFLDPNFKIGLTHRDAEPGSMMPMTNKETLAIPLRVSFQATNRLAVYARTGLTGGGLSIDPNPGIALDNFGDTWAIPLGIGTQFGITTRFDIGLEFMLPTLVWPGRGDTDPGAFDIRSLILFADYRI